MIQTHATEVDNFLERIVYQNQINQVQMVYDAFCDGK